MCLPLVKKLSRDEIINLSDIPKQKHASQVKKEELTNDFENELKSNGTNENYLFVMPHNLHYLNLYPNPHLLHVTQLDCITSLKLTLRTI
jgi:hypothetical protein